MSHLNHLYSISEEESDNDNDNDNDNDYEYEYECIYKYKHIKDDKSEKPSHEIETTMVVVNPFINKNKHKHKHKNKKERQLLIGRVIYFTIIICLSSYVIFYHTFDYQ
jgi:hypothetical protein